MISKTAAFLLAGLAGVAALLLGQAWDFYLHAADPTLAHREGIFAVTNPGHVLLGIGLPLVVVGVLGAAYTHFPLGPWGRRGFLATFAALILVSGAVAGWAASVELSNRQQLVSIASQQAASLSHHQAATTLPNTAPTVVPVTAAQLEAAARLLRDTLAAVAKYRDQRVAVAAGYQPMEPPDQEIVHFVNRAYFTNADVLKPQHVQSLIYYNGAKGPILIGAMYIMPRAGMPGPEIGGSLTSWHNHENLCFDNQTNMPVAFVGDAFFDNNSGWSRSCPKGSSKQDTPEMLHVWVIDNPAGPFDSDMNPADIGTILSSSASK